MILNPRLELSSITKTNNAITRASTISSMSDADILHQQIQSKQEFDLTPHFKYLMTGACNNCSGMLQEKDIRYTKPKSTLIFKDNWTNDKYPKFSKPIKESDE